MLDEKTDQLKHKAVEEAKRLFFITAYLWTLFSVFELHCAAVLRAQHVHFSYSRCSVSGTKLRISSFATNRFTRRSASGKSFLSPRRPRFDCACARCKVPDFGACAFPLRPDWFPVPFQRPPDRFPVLCR